MEKKEKMQLVFNILLIIIIAIMIIAIIFLVRNKNIIQSDPLIYGMNIHKFSSCSCVDKNGLWWKSVGNGFVSQEYSGAITDDDLINWSGFQNGTG